MKIIEIEFQRNEELIKEQLQQNSFIKAPALAELDEMQISLGIEENGKVVSRIVGHIFFNGLHVEFFASEQDSRGKGYGTKLFEYVEQLAISKGCHYIFLETMSFDAPNFYLKHGFEIMKKVEDSPIKGESHYFMFKSLI